MVNTIDTAQENRVRQLAAGLGYRLMKSRQDIHLDNLGEYQLVDRNGVVLGSRFEASLDQIEAYLRDEAKQ